MQFSLPQNDTKGHVQEMNRKKPMKCTVLVIKIVSCTVHTLHMEISGMKTGTVHEIK